MLPLSVYLDETGAATTEFFGVAGVLAPDDSWKDFERRWLQALEEFKIPYFHMVEFAHSTGVFKDWKGNEPKRRELFGKLLGILATAYPIPFGAVMRMSDFQSLPQRRRNLLGNPYDYTLNMTSSILMMLADSLGLKEGLALIMSEQLEYKGFTLGLPRQ
jgi:hypothetical protein